MQFGKPTADMPTNQAKIAEMLAGLHTSRLLVYHAAHLLDMHKEAMVDAATAKLFTSEMYENLISTAVMVMGGDGWTRFYPVESYLRDAKVNQIGAGTNDIMKLVILRGGLKALGKDLRMPQRKIDEKLGVPISTSEPLPKMNTDEKNVLQMLAEDYQTNPGLFMSREDIKDRLNDATDDKLNQVLESLESKELVKLYRDGRGSITLVKATYDGLRKTSPLEKFKWYPDWLDKNFIF
jgi:hypothetical protein